MSAFDRRQIARLDSRTDILEVFKYYGIDCEPDGCEQRYRALCPFHVEKSPSLKIYPETNSWYAFCCGKGFRSYDFIKTQETNEKEADKVLLELAHVKNYDDSIEEVTDILAEEEETSNKKFKNQTVYLISITLRDFLISKKKMLDYSKWCIEIDEWFKKLDSLLDDDNHTEQDVALFLQTITTYIQSH